MAVYNPNINFFIEQIKSLNEQDYKNIELIVIDDCSNVESKNQVSELLSKNITNFPFTFISNQTNMGSNKTFEEMTRIAKGDYFAYCDQDDIWEKNKLTTLIKKIKEVNAVIAYSDLSIIDQDGNKISNSFKDVSKRLEHKFGENLFGYFLRRNSITGCTMLIKASTAVKALPFPPSDIYVHDHWLALYGSHEGEIAYVEEPLIRYRIHSNNQIGAKVLPGINDKNDYLNKRIKTEEKKVQFVKSRFSKDNQVEINQYENFTINRKNYFEHTNLTNLIGMVNQIQRDPVLIGFEILLGMSRGFVMNKILNLAKK